MQVELSDFRFPIPYKQIELAELRAVERIHESRTLRSRGFLGEVKVSNRLTVILLCYFLSVLAMAKSSEEDNSRTVFFLCKTEERKTELVYSAEKLKRFLAKKLPSEARSEVENEVKVFSSGEAFEKAGSRSRRLFVLPVKQYLEIKLQIEELTYWRNHMDPCMEIDLNKFSHFYKVFKRIDFLFLETNDLEGLLDDILTLRISELHLFRAAVECSKLQRFYNFRFDSKAKATAKRQNSVVEIKHMQDEDYHGENNKEMGKADRRGGWFIEDYDKKFSELAKRKQNSLKTTKLGEYATMNRLQIDFMECYFLMHLETIYYLSNHLVMEYYSSKGDECQSAEDFIKHLFKSTHLGAIEVKKLRKILVTFVGRYPPRVKNRELSIFYLEQVLCFFEKIVLWHQMFETVSTAPEQPLNTQSKFMLFHFVTELNFPNNVSKPHKEQQIKLTTYDKEILFQLLTDGSKAFCCFQNHGYSLDYFNEAFKYAKTPAGKDSYHCPVAASKETKTLTKGLIVNSTPNDEDLHINSDRGSRREEGSEPEEKKEMGEHYWQIIRSYGVLIYDLCEVVADGVVVYFPTREILKECRAEWEVKENIYERIYQKKKIFEEEDLQEANSQNVAEYRKLCDIGRGAVFFLSAQSTFSKSQTFFNHYSRCVVFVGLPYPAIKIEAEIKFRQLNYKNHDKGKFHLFCFEEAMKTVVRCLSNCGNDPAQNRVVVFADAEFRSENTIKKWLPMIDDGTLNTSTVIQKVTLIMSRSQQLWREREERERELKKKQTYFLLT